LQKICDRRRGVAGVAIVGVGADGDAALKATARAQVPRAGVVQQLERDGEPSDKI